MLDVHVVSYVHSVLAAVNVGEGVYRWGNERELRLLHEVGHAQFLASVY